MMITGKVKIGIEEFKEDIISTVIDRPSVEEYLALNGASINFGNVRMSSS